MATIQRFEDIEAWKKARELSNAVYVATRKPAFTKDFELRNQIRSAAISVMSNIAEGYERDGNREFCQFLSIAKGSAGEIRSQLYIALDAGYIDTDEFRNLAGLAVEVSRMIRAFMRYLSHTDIRGEKFKTE